MSIKHRKLSYLMTTILLVLFSCTKDVGLVTEVEFELGVQHQPGGFIDEPLNTAITVVPEMEVEGYEYSFIYNVEEGEGSYVNEDGNLIPEGERIPLAVYSANIQYRGTIAGEHTVRIIVEDNYGFSKEEKLVYTVTEIPLIWTAESTVNTITLGESVSISLTFDSGMTPEGTSFERNFSITSGSGTLSLSGTDLVLEEYTSIEEGTYSLLFTPNTLGNAILTFVLRDSRGEEYSTSVIFMVEAVDTVPPVITLNGNTTINLTVGDAYTDPGYSANDNVDGDITAQVTVDESLVDTGQVGTYQVTYNVSDAAGNAAQEMVRTINVTDNQQDNQPPIAVNDFYNTVIDGAISFDPRQNDSDPESDALTIIAVSEVMPTGSGSVAFDGQSITYTPATGSTLSSTFSYAINDGTPGNNAEATITVTFISNEDTVPPLITLTGNTTVDLTVGDTYSDPGYSATDDVDGDITAQVMVDESTVDTGQAGTYQVTYNVSDAAGNAAQEVVRTVNVNSPSNTPPVAVEDNFTVAEDGVLNNSVLSNDMDADADGLIVDLVNNSPANIGVNVNGTAGGVFVIDAGGNLSFDPNGEFDSLNNGETAVTTVTYRINDGNGGSASATVTVTITGVGSSDTVPPLIILSGNSTIDLIVGNTYIDPGYTATDDVDGNITSQVIVDESTVNTDQVGSYQVTYNVTDAAGNAAPEVIRTINVNAPNNDPPIANNDNFTGIGETQDFTGNVFIANGGLPDNDPNGDSFTVSKVNGSTSLVGISLGGIAGGLFTINTDGSFSFDPDGDFDALNNGDSQTTSVTYNISDGTLESNSATVSVTINGSGTSNMDPVASIQASPLSGIAPLTVDFDGSASTDDNEITLIQWSFGDGTNNTGLDYTISHTYTTPGTYTASIEVRDVEGAFDTATVMIEVLAPPVAVMTANPTSGFAPLTVNFDGSGSTNSSLINSYQWSFGDGTTGSGATISHTYTTPGTYTATLLIVYAGGTDSVNVVITVNSNNVNAVISATPTTGTAPLTVTFDASGSSADAGISVFYWNFDDGTGTNSGSNTTSYTFNDPGTYNVVLTAETAGGDSDTDMITIEVLSPNQPPVAQDDMITLSDLSPIDINVLGNDSDPDMDMISIIANTNPSSGSITEITDGFRYTPTSSCADTSFTYTISDGSLEATATVMITAPPLADITNNDTVTPSAPSNSGTITVHCDNVYFRISAFGGSNGTTITFNIDGEVYSVSAGNNESNFTDTPIFPIGTYSYSLNGSFSGTSGNGGGLSAQR